MLVEINTFELGSISVSPIHYNGDDDDEDVWTQQTRYNTYVCGKGSVIINLDFVVLITQESAIVYDNKDNARESSCARSLTYYNIYIDTPHNTYVYHINEKEYDIIKNLYINKCNERNVL